MATAILKHEFTDIVKYHLVKRLVIAEKTKDGSCICGQKKKSAIHGFIRVDGL